jgi:hypothetical protein
VRGVEKNIDPEENPVVKLLETILLFPQDEVTIPVNRKYTQHQLLKINTYQRLQEKKGNEKEKEKYQPPINSEYEEDHILYMEQVEQQALYLLEPGDRMKVNRKLRFFNTYFYINTLEDFQKRKRRTTQKQRLMKLEVPAFDRKVLVPGFEKKSNLFHQIIRFMSGDHY